MSGSLGPPRWRGEKGRTEVWYLTFTDPTSGWAGWVHGETVSPTGDDEPYAHGWAAFFPPDGGGPPVVERFGPSPAKRASTGVWFAVDGVEIGEGCWRGATDSLAWELAVGDGGPALYTFPKPVWERQLLPGAQVVPVPNAAVHGRITIGDDSIGVRATGGVARIFGHGSAERWGWLHAALDGDGVLEIVTASARRPGLRRVPPLAMVQLRLDGRRDWPSNPLLAGPRFRTRLRPDGFSVKGRGLSVDVTLPPERTVVLGYVDPDGATATCSNSERAVARIELNERGTTRRWHLDGTAHAEVGRRP